MPPFGVAFMYLAAPFNRNLNFTVEILNDIYIPLAVMINTDIPGMSSFCSSKLYLNVNFHALTIH